MKQIFVYIFLFLTFANSQEWIPLKSLEGYKSQDFNLKEGVEYAEVRTYYGDNEYKTDSYAVEATMGTKTLVDYDAKFVEYFKSIKPDFNQAGIRKSKMCSFMGCRVKASNVFVVLKDKSVWRMNEVKDVGEYLGDIDTEAELKLVFWLNNEYTTINDHEHKESYKKVKDGYLLKAYNINHVMNYAPCGEFTYEYFVNNKGEISGKKLIKKVLIDDCVVAD